METLIEKITSQFGLTAEQAASIVELVKAHLATNNKTTDSSKPNEESFLDKATHFVEEHVPEGLKKAEDALGDVGKKIKGLFSKDKD
jgi:hypothetical protein